MIEPGSRGLADRAPVLSEFDVIVVGSGLSGGWVAKEMCERGFKVAVVERGRKIDRAKDYTDFQAPWDLEHLGMVGPKDKELHPVQSEVYAFKPHTSQFWVKDADHPYETPEDKPFHWYRGYHEGGRSIMWGRQSYRWSETDFEANEKDGHGVDWPVRYSDIQKWYDHVERFAGISGSREGLEILPDGVFQPPFELNCGERYIKEKVEGAFPGRHVIPGRVANLTAPTDEQLALGRGRCQSRNYCHRGCSFGAYFSSNSATLPAAQRTGNYTFIGDTAVSSVDYDPETHRVTGVDTYNSVTGDTRRMTARVIFLNASTIATSVILLNSRSERFPNGLANSSGQVGHNLMDHLIGPGAVGVIPGLQDRYYSGRRPNGIYIPRFRNHTEPGDGYIRGFGYQGSAFRLDWRFNARSAGIGQDFKARMRSPTYWVIALGGFCEMLPDDSNRVELHPSKVDKEGVPVPIISASAGANDERLAEQAAKDAAEMLQAAGCVRVSPTLSDSKYLALGKGIHEMGTARMGRDPETSVLNQWNQAHDVPNLFISDGSFMASSACQNPSLTYMAFSARAADYAAQQLRDGAI